MRPGKPSIMLRILMLALVSAPNALLHAQSLTLSPERDSIVLGEQVQLELKLITPPGSRIGRWPVLPDTFDQLELVGRGSIDSARLGDRMQYTQKFTVTGFEPGRRVIPTVSATVDGREYSTETRILDVRPVSLEGNDYNDIREIREAGPEGPDWTRILIFTLGFATLAFLLYRWWRNRPVRDVPAIPVSKGTAYEEAMRAMRVLREEQLPEKGEIKAYYTRLCDIYRVYLGTVSGRNMMQQTTDGILLQLKQEMQGPVLSGTAEALRICDAVKFARYLPSTTQCADTMDQFTQSIEVLNRRR